MTKDGRLMAEENLKPKPIELPAVLSPAIPSNRGQPAVTVASSIVESLQEQLISIRRDAISVLRVTEDLLRLPPEKRALRTRAERRSSPGDGAGSGGAGSVGAGRYAINRQVKQSRGRFSTLSRHGRRWKR